MLENNNTQRGGRQRLELIRINHAKYVLRKWGLEVWNRVQEILSIVCFAKSYNPT